MESRKIQVNYDKEDITFDMNILLKCEILSTSKIIKIPKEKMKELEKKISERVKNDISQAIETSQKEYGCDYLYFYKYFRAKYNSDFKKMNGMKSIKRLELIFRLRLKFQLEI